MTGLTNNATDLFFKEIIKLEISYKDEGEPYISLLYNGFDDSSNVNEFLINLVAQTKQEVLNNLLLLNDSKGREDYLKRVWLKCLDADPYLVSSSILFEPGGKLNGELKNWEWGIEGYIIENQNVKINLPDEYEFTVFNEPEFLEKCFDIYSQRLLYMWEFIFSVCKNQNVNIDLNKEQLHEYFKRQIEQTSPYPTITKKLKWNGTPGEFGAIFNLLFGNGYIDIVKDKANMVRVLNEIFEIKNEAGKEVDAKYLYKCFGEKEKKYNPGQLKIPFSDNYRTG